MNPRNKEIKKFKPGGGLTQFRFNVNSRRSIDKNAGKLPVMVKIKAQHGHLLEAAIMKHEIMKAIQKANRQIKETGGLPMGYEIEM